MGSGSSRPRSNSSGSRSNRPINRSPSRIFSSMICGGSSSSSSSSRAAAEMEDRPYEMLMSSVQNSDPVSSKLDIPVHESSTNIGAEVVSASSDGVIGHSSTTSIASNKRRVGDSGLGNTGTSNQERRFSESLEFVSSRVSDEYSFNDSFRNRYSGEASSSFREQQASSHPSVNNSANKDSVNGMHNPDNCDVRQAVPRTVYAESSSQGLQASTFDGASVNNYMDEMSPWSLHNSDSGSQSVEVRPVSSSLRDESLQEEAAEGLGLVVSEHMQDDGDVLHVDVVSISSSIFSRNNGDTTSHEGRRNSRRLFWDAFSRRSSWRPIDPPTVALSTESSDDLGSHDRWLLDFSGDFRNDGVSSDAGYLGSRIRNWNDRRRQSRSEIWERLVGSLDENEGRTTTLCPSGLHPDGTCSCESLLTSGESSTRASISRIVMLAEALFEVLDEIHRQPSSLSLSMVALPAPECVVDSFPLKNHRKEDNIEVGDEVDQCYICLSEYEEGDKIRVLPCHHEYHMSCVDKWLKEIHGVCPLCRGDVRQGTTEPSSVCTSEIPSNSL
ncbi:E3 ubiquitin-protein ligase RNF167 [Linum grandiflorum]